MMYDMHILIACDQHWPMKSGVAATSRMLALSLAERGHKVLVIAPSQTGKEYEETDKNYQIARTRSIKFPFRQNYRIAVAMERRMRKIITDFQPDIVHVQTQFPVGLTALKIANKLDIPVVASNHSMPENIIKHFKPLEPFARPINRVLLDYGLLLYKGADYIIMPTQSAIDLFKTENLGIPMSPVSNGIDLDYYKPGKPPENFYKKYKLDKSVPMVTYIGRLDGEKHVHILIEAVAKVLQTMPVHLFIVGDGADGDRLRELVVELGLTQHVSMPGKIDDDDKLWALQASALFAMPSPAELQCMALMEGMATGLPAVAVNVSALPELCRDGENGYLCAVDDPDDMADKIVKILSDKKLAASMGKASLKIIEKHDKKHVITEFERIYNVVLASHVPIKDTEPSWL